MSMNCGPTNASNGGGVLPDRAEAGREHVLMRFVDADADDERRELKSAQLRRKLPAGDEDDIVAGHPPDDRTDDREPRLMNPLAR